MERASQLLRSLNKEARIIEIGPSFNPLAPKRDGWNTIVVDHASREALREKYHDQTIDRIEAVDIVWTGGSLADAVPRDQYGTFDAFIASHVIEHTTDIVTFLRAAETLLKPEGVVILAVPDKRKCFDFYRPLSATADAITAFLERRDRHTLRTHIDYALTMALKPGGIGAWAASDVRLAEPANPLTDAPQWHAAAQHRDYADAHAWVFVPSSFSLMILELSLLGYLDLRVEDVQEQHATEFFVWLRKGGPRLSADDARRDRTALMQRVVVEVADQARQLPDGPLGESAALLRDHLLKAEYRAQALRRVLSAVQASLGRFGLNNRRFKQQIVQAGLQVPANALAPIQHHILLSETTKILNRGKTPYGLSAHVDDDPALAENAVLVVPLGAAQFRDPLLAAELTRERQRSLAVRVVLQAVVDSLSPRSWDKKRFKTLIAKAAQETPTIGPEAVRHTVLAEESRRVLGVPRA